MFDRGADIVRRPPHALSGCAGDAQKRFSRLPSRDAIARDVP
jgi:hypothetical protein